MRLLISAICLSVLLPAAAIAGDITVTITGVEDGQGSVRGAIYDSPASFMKLPLAKAKFRIAAAAGKVIYVFHNLGPGKYAVSAFHDVKDTGALTRNSYGVPTEGYGFSNDAQGQGGPPPFGQAAFDFDGRSKAITIALDH